jgi:hypothetical protein
MKTLRTDSLVRMFVKIRCTLLYTLRSYPIIYAKFVIWHISTSLWNLADKLKDQSVYEMGVLVRKDFKIGPCIPLYVWRWNEMTRESFNCEVNHLTPNKNKGVDRNWYTSLSGHWHLVNHGQRYGRTGKNTKSLSSSKKILL